MKVVELVQAQMANGWSPEELYFQFPHLSLGQIHSALAYYWDHKDEIDDDAMARNGQTDRIQEAIGEAPIVGAL